MTPLVSFLAVMALELTPDGGTAASARAKAAPAVCTGQSPDDAEAKDVRKNIETDDKFYAFAVSLWGAPVSCEYKPQTYEGQSFHTVEYRFADGSTFLWQTSPPETTVVRLLGAKPFPNEKAARKFLAANVSDVNIDWSGNPSTDTDAKARTTTKTWWDPEEGLNAGADLIYRGKKLVGIGFHMAL